MCVLLLVPLLLRFLLVKNVEGGDVRLDALCLVKPASAMMKESWVTVTQPTGNSNPVDWGPRYRVAGHLTALWVL